MAETFGKRVKRLRMEAGLKQAELAERAGVTLFNIRHMEQDKNDNPSRKILIGLARALGVTLDQLAGE